MTDSHSAIALAVRMLTAAALVLMTCTYVNPASATVIPDNGTLLGVTYNPAESEQDIKDLRSFEEWSGKKHSVVVVFQGFSPDEQSPIPKTQLDNLWQNGNTPLLSIEPWGSGDGDILGVINNGTLDQYFKEYAKDLKNWTCEDWTVDNRTGTGKQVFIRFAHEMNLHYEMNLYPDVYPWSNRSPASYTDAWKRVHSIFESEGPAPDAVQWVWCVNHVDVPSDGHRAEEYYPGDEYVDWVAIDGYNVGKSVPCAKWDNWTDFDGIFGPMLDRFDDHQNISKKPYAIIEFASSSVVDSMPVKEFNIYTNKDSPTNHYIPSGWWGDWGDITFCDDDRSDPHLGIACCNTSVKLIYSAEGSQSNGWAGIRWQEGGYNLTGADNLTLWARGEYGGERAEFTAGDVAASTGVVTLTSIWQRYAIDLTDMDLSHVACGFYWGTSKDDNPDGCTIYLDDIRYESSTGIKDVCVEEGVSNNTKKGEWITETYNSIKNYPNIKMVCYFNVDKGGTKYLTGESDWAVFTTPRDNRNNIDDCSFDPDKRIAQYNESVRDNYYIYRFPLYLEDKGIYVDDNFTDDPENHRWDSIQEGINDASDGYTIFVHNGTYYENVVVNKSLTLMGENRNNTIIDGVGSGEVIQVTANNCVISGFMVRNGGDCGMELYYSSNNTITGNTISSNGRGIYLTNHSSNNTIAENTVADNRYYGIHIFYINAENTIIANNVSNNGGGGIFLRDYNDNNVIINNNIVSNNGDGICLLWACDYNNITGNMVLNNGMRGIYIQDLGDHNVIMNNNISSNMGDGILLHWGSDQNIITGNTVTNNQNGIVIRYSSDSNIVTNNTISSNNDTGISLTWVYYWGSSDNNLIYHNNLINNAKQAYDNGTNSWDSSSVDGGNYWNDHICTGNPSDGSQPYTIGGGAGAVDHYPFESMNGWSTTPQKGDLNSDGSITPADAAIALRLAATGTDDPSADVSGDDAVASLDALMIMQAAAEAINL